MKIGNKKERRNIIAAMVIASSIVLAMNPETIFAMEKNLDEVIVDNKLTSSKEETSNQASEVNNILAETKEVKAESKVDQANNDAASQEEAKEESKQNNDKARTAKALPGQANEIGQVAADQPESAQASLTESREDAKKEDDDKPDKEKAIPSGKKSDQTALDQEKSEEKLGKKEENPKENTEKKDNKDPEKTEIEEDKPKAETQGNNESSQTDADELELDEAKPKEAVGQPVQNQVEDKTIYLLKDGENIGGFDTLKQVIDKMYELTKDGIKYNFTIEVNQDIDLTDYSQFGFPYGKVTLKSKNSENPRRIKANNTDHTMMLGVVNGADLTVENIIIDGNNEKRLFWVESTEKLPASLTINNGAILENGKVDPSDQTKHGAAIYCQEAGNVTIKGGIIRNNEAISHGGAICYIGTGSLTINGGEISNNKALSGSGGAIYLQGKGTINGGKIKDNTAYNGGGIATGKNTNLEITGGEIRENNGIYAGGGIYCASNSTVKLTGGQISKNKGKYGGGVTAVYNSNFIMDGTGVISENEAYTGGGFYPWGTTPSCDLISGTIEKNKANYGGGIRLRSPKAKIGGVVIRENIANYGGGIYSSLPEGKSLTIDGVKIYKNEALSGGGVFIVDETGSLNFKNSEFKENKAYYGGGIWTSNSMKIENSSFEGNEAIKSEPSILPNGKHENNGHGGAIYVNTKLAKDGVVTVDGCTFTKNKADKSGGAISVDETHGLLKVINNTVFDGNEATGELGHGGAIYSNLHAYMPEYDDGSTGPLVQPPTSADFYLNISTDKTTVFKNNKAFRTFTPPSTKDEFDKLLYKSTSHPGTKYNHPLNNDDINLIIFKNVIFHKNYDTEDPIFDAFLVMEKSKLGDYFPDSVPTRPGYRFKKWNTKSNGNGDEFTGENIIEDDMIVYATYDMEIIKINEAPKLVVQDKTINKGDNLNLIDLVESATDEEDGDLREKVSIINDGGFDKDRIGVYSVRFKVSDSIGASMVKIAKVSVVENPKPDQSDKPTEPDKPIVPDKPIEPDNPIKPNEPDLPIIPIEPSQIDDDTIRVVDEPEDKPIDDEKTPKQDNDEEVDKPSKPEKKDEPVLIAPIKKKLSANPKTGVAPGMSLTSIISSLLGSTFGLHILKKKKD